MSWSRLLAGEILVVMKWLDGRHVVEEISDHGVGGKTEYTLRTVAVCLRPRNARIVLASACE